MADINPAAKLLAIDLIGELPALWGKHPDGLTIAMVAQILGCKRHEAFAARLWVERLGKGRIVGRPDRTPDYLVPLDWKAPAWDLTKKQRETLDWLVSQADESGFVSASYRDICRGTSRTQGGIVAHMDALDKKDYLRCIDRGDHHRKASYRVFPKGDATGAGARPSFSRWSCLRDGIDERADL